MRDKLSEAIFLLLELGLETIKPEEADLSVIVSLEQNDWDRLKTIVEQQGVGAIAVDGVNKIINSFGKSILASNIDAKWWQVFLCEWIGKMFTIEEVNKLHNVVTEKIASKWMEQGIRVMIMKGQANGLMYPQPNHRSPGDIDCYLFENYKKGNDVAKSLGLAVDESWYKHSEIDCGGVIIENHHLFVQTRNGKRSMLLENELEEALQVEDDCFESLTPSTITPPIQWTAMFQAYHACGHFLTEGLRLKQLIDWAILLQTHQNDIDWKAFYSFCERYHLKKFVLSITAICCDKLNTSITNPEIEYYRNYTDIIVDSIMMDNDYIYSEGEGKCKEKWHIVKNLFRYRWKYKEIYEESIWKQLWYYTSGYLFKTEKIS